MKMTENIHGKVIQIFLDGKLDINSSDQVLKDIRERISKDQNQVVISFEKVPFISSFGLRVVLITMKELRQNFKGELHVACLQPTVRRVFEITQLMRELSVFDTVEEATLAFL